MSNSTACTRSFKKLNLSDSSTMVASGDSEYLTAPATGTVSPAGSSSSTFLSVCSEGMMESGKCASVEQLIERSKSHWSHVVEYCDSDEGEAEESNVHVFKTLQSHPKCGPFFATFGYDLGIWESFGELEVGEKFAEGGQAELFHAHITWSNPRSNEWDLEHGHEWVLKVFKKGTFLRQLQAQWPLGVLQDVANTTAQYKSTSEPIFCNTCDVTKGVLLKDGRFAFLIRREQEDLCNLINCCMMVRTAQDSGPFSEDVAKFIMYNVALGMDWLHMRNIVHRDLKASNVLVTNYRDESGYGFYVADYECSVGVIGTGFFRAPEILQACKDRNVSQRPEVFTKEADVYSYGMTCYEILTGKLPFEGHPLNDYDIVLNGNGQSFLNMLMIGHEDF